MELLVAFASAFRQGQPRPVFPSGLLHIRFQITPFGQIDQRPGDGRLVLVAQAAQLRRRQATRSLADIVQAHDVAAFEPHPLGFPVLDLLKAFVSPGNGCGKALKLLGNPVHFSLPAPLLSPA